MRAENFLAEVSIFWFMKRRDLKRVAERAQYRLYGRGDVIIREGDRDARLFVILSGETEVIKDLGEEGERHLGKLGPRSYFGEMAMIDGSARSASVVARAETEVLSLDRWDLCQEIEKYPLLGIELLQMLGRRIRAIEKRMMRTLGAVLPICAHCGKIRQEDGSWMAIEEYILDHSEPETHRSVCPECSRT